MLAKLRYGNSSTLNLTLAADAQVAVCEAPRGAAVADARQAMSAALESPLDFPALAQSVVPGDKVAIALEPAIPQAAALIAGLIPVLVDAGIAPADITLVRSVADEAAEVADPRELLSADYRRLVRLETHDPTNRDRLSYLAASPGGKPIYVNRTLCEADLLIPLGVARLDGSLGYTGPASGLFPVFSDEQAAGRFRSPRLLHSAERNAKLRKQADEVAWLMGVLFAIQIVPGGANDILHIVAGRSDLVFRRAQALCQEAWGFSVPARASLVVAAVEGAHGPQSWENLGRALRAASRVVSEEGAIALCTDLAAELGPGTQRLCNAEDLDIVLKELGEERPVDTLVAAELAHALQRGRVYLLSQLDEVLLEEMGIGRISNEVELARLVACHDSCILLTNAQYALATLNDETLDA